MLFQTFDFIVFFLVAVILIYFTKGYAQRTILLCASLFFYAYGSIQHLFVFILVIGITYLFGILIEKKQNKFIFSQIISNDILFYIINTPPPPPPSCFRFY
jgi:hypothetical protein